MNITKLQSLFAAALSALALFSCSGEDDPNFTECPVSFSQPSGYEDIEADSVKLVVRNVSNNVETTYSLDNYPVQINIEDGIYDFTLYVYVTKTDGTRKYSEVLRDAKQNVSVSGGECSLSFNPVRISGGQGFVLADICLNSRLPEGVKTNIGYAWFRIYNNSSDVLYADSLCLFETKFNTTNKFANYQPDVMNEAVTLIALYQIPGSGKDYPVQPGESILIADRAIDHTETNALALDLSSANFEWYDETTNGLDVDNLDVPNLTCVWKSSKSVWTPNIQANTVFGIGYIGGESGALANDEYLTDYVYDYSYDQTITGKDGTTTTKTMTQKGFYKFPNQWVLDAVTFAPSEAYVWNVTAQSIDAGYVSLGATGSDANRLGKSARRKFADGAIVDTNNSSVDFNVIDADKVDPFYVFK